VLRAQRLREIVRRTEVQGSIRAVELARELGVDVSTVRRDLAHLGRTGLVERARGGALRAEPGRTIDIPYDLKRSVELDAKTAIGKAAAERVRVGETILIDSGSTTFQMLPWLRQRRGITVGEYDPAIPANPVEQIFLCPAHAGQASGIHRDHQASGKGLRVREKISLPIMTRLVGAEVIRI